MLYLDARRFAQYSRLASDSFFRYSGVSHCARFALNSSEFIVALSLALRCAKASGSDIFSRLRSWAARMPSMRFFLISGSEFKILWYSRMGFDGSRSFFLFSSKTSCLGAVTPSPPSVKFASVPPLFTLLKCAIKERSIAQASSHESFVNLWTRTFSGPYFSTSRKHREFRSFFFIREGFQRLGVFPMPT